MLESSPLPPTSLRATFSPMGTDTPIHPPRLRDQRCGRGPRTGIAPACPGTTPGWRGSRHSRTRHRTKSGTAQTSQRARLAPSRTALWVSGMQHSGWRYYTPGLGRWLSRDPIGENGGVNLLAIAANDAVGRVDAVGLDMAACNAVRAAAETWSLVATVRAMVVPDSWSYPWGMPVPCLTWIRCGRCCRGGERGNYNPHSGGITLCAGNDVDR